MGNRVMGPLERMPGSGRFTQFLELTRWRLGESLRRAQKLFKSYQDSHSEPAERERMYALFNLVKPYTMIYFEELFNLYKLACAVQKSGVPGAIVECGVCNGGSAAVLASAFATSPRRLWLYDNFDGLPPAGPEDGAVAPLFTGMFKGTVDNVGKVLAKVGFPPEHVVLRNGLFAHTFAQPLPDQVALLHIDSDWYESELLSLKTFYPRMPDGGVVILDDYGYWEGSRKAFYAFCRECDVEPLLERQGIGQAYWVKGREHNRA